MDYSSLKPGLSGIMRVKNDARFIDGCIESCIDALDELIIVYNDCTDESPEVIERNRQRYPDKIKVFPYEHHILSLNLSEDEYEFVKSLPEDDPRLLCSYYNFALEKVSYRHAIKIDADQLYFTDLLVEWGDFYRNSESVHVSFNAVVGSLVYLHMKISTVICRKLNRTCRLLPAEYPGWLQRAYKSFVRFCAARYGANVMMSGVNTVCVDGKYVVPLGFKDDVINILPPFNGIGDHVFFRVSEQCHYRRYICEEYSKYRSEKYTVIERFVCPGMYLPGGFLWFHLNMSRPEAHDKIEIVYRKRKERFIALDGLNDNSYYQIDSEIHVDMFGRDARSFFQFTYAMFGQTIQSFLKMLR